MRVIETPILEVEPVYDTRTWAALRQIAREREHRERLERAGVTPTRSALFIGAPGVGKTLAAKWIARELDQPLAILDLSAVMSSFLGRTGSNVRAVLDFARDHNCILLLDELDAVAKRRDDSSEIGELKRLVTVLLQEIDEWPPDCLLLAATNHAKLLDPAIWRRFEVVVDFPLPEPGAVETVLRDHLELDPQSRWPAVLSRALAGSSFSDASQTASQARRLAALDECNVETALELVLHDFVKSLQHPRRKEFAISLAQEGVVSQRQASALTGVSRDTIRKHVRSASGEQC
ncbi:MAG: ATP-binding protein [Gemmatimonadota bacterium]|nr:ATP-binding protein [Gemmatimonadota bacterium]